jgi:hypothetical protein
MHNADDPSVIIDALSDLMQCTARRSPLVNPIIEALRMPTLELSPYEHPTLNPTPSGVFTYMTFYAPEDVHIDFATTSVRVPIDGTGMFITGRRDPDGDLIMQENFTKPMPTAMSSLYDIHPIGDGDAGDSEGETEEDKANKWRIMRLPEMSRGFVYDMYDPDFYAADAAMTRIGHAGLPPVHALYIDALIHFRDRVRFPDPDDYKARLFEAVPELDPDMGVPLPFAFPPIAYTIDRYLALGVHKWKQIPNFPFANALARLNDTLVRTEGKSSKNANNAFDRMSDRYGYADRAKMIAVKRRRAHETPVDANPRPAKRARHDEPPPPDDSDAMDIDEPPQPAANRLIPKYVAPASDEEESSAGLVESTDDGLFD